MQRHFTGKLTSKGQLTIPAELRNQWGLEEGDRLMIEIDDETGQVISMKPQKKRSIRESVGLLKTNIKYDEHAINDAIGAEVSANYLRSIER
ncbi:AbrB/MazE/SpoVT family DNA-binding domain-containing protein [Paenibacillus soyae]|uniref:AbrB/MazE/SpoVT family DNA-binding domain-containing protein n=1 Tax=Paenibacillus soyae TaxID=2969249 RepID=A0A9X2MSC4_9BACL|nr:AbrB/MazE/SpoVT family DNA-binding domain-containing protein [Paenibacillus soyae]MCR2805480.1 AbrB/MazE/SpoVT family DNA-binding domain-containing protein [Paenibacillus soyae]